MFNHNKNIAAHVRNGPKTACQNRTISYVPVTELPFQSDRNIHIPHQEIYGHIVLDGDTKLHAEARKGNAKAVSTFLSTLKIKDINKTLTTKNRFGLTVLNTAVAYGHTNVIKAIWNHPKTPKGILQLPSSINVAWHFKQNDVVKLLQDIINSTTHTGEKPYKCNICSRAYTQKQSLQRHQSKKHGSNRHNGIT